MKHFAILTALLISMGCTAGELKLELHGTGMTGIPLMIRIYDADISFPKGKYIREINLLAGSDHTATTVSDLPTGKYAIAVFADINQNGKLDRSFIGKPSEPYGFSNDARHLFGPPDFNEASFELKDAAVLQSILLR
ncbi:MAG: DUF2141 domain-containing protein [Gallionella sp.]|jgi:uncharacterized protein (DUF2141 family)